MKKNYTMALACGSIMLFAVTGCDKANNQPGQTGKEFEITLTSAGTGDMNVKVTPDEDVTTYYCDIIAKADYNEQDGLQAVSDEIISGFESLATERGVTIEEIITPYLKEGAQDIYFHALDPETDYLVFTFGLQADGEQLTNVNYAEFKTGSVSFLGTKFEISAENISQSSFTLYITPDDNDARYYYNAMSEEEFKTFCNSDPSALQNTLKSYFSVLKEQYPDMTSGEFAESITVKGETRDEDTFNNLDPESEFHVFAVSLANDVTMVSDVAYKMIATSEEPKNEFSLRNEQLSDVSYTAIVETTISSSYYAAVMELREYFEGMDDAEILSTLSAANGGSFTKYLHNDDSYVEFDKLIPSDEYYLLVFDCNPDGTPVSSEDDMNMMKFSIDTPEATMSNTTYELSVSDITQNTARVQIIDTPVDANETFMMNVLLKSDYEAMSDKEEGLKEHMNAFWETKLEEWKSNNPEYADAMSMKEFMSRNLMDEAALGVTYGVEGLEEGTSYIAYVFGMKADGTFTTAPFTVEFKTAGTQESLATIDDIKATALDKDGQTYYALWVYPGGNYDKFYGKIMAGTDEWSTLSKDEIIEELKKEPGSQWSRSYGLYADWGSSWYFYTVCVDIKGVPTDVYKVSYDVPASGEGSTSQKNIEIEITTL